MRLSSKTAADVYKAISQRVIGQESAKRNLATLLAMHLAWFSRADLAHTAPNALVIGPTGVGKTHAIRTAAEALKIPLVIVDATRLSPPGYPGTSLEDILVELVSASRQLRGEANAAQLEDLGLPEPDELEIARRGVVFIDEFDKLSTTAGPTGERNELLQRRLLQFVDGTTVTLNPYLDRGEKEVRFETQGLMFIAAGAFTNLLEDAAKRPQERMRGMLEHDHVILEDLVRFGFMEELIARLPVLIEFNSLETTDLEQILKTEAVDPSLFYVRYLEALGTRLSITDDAREYIAKRAVELGIGARGLHQVLFPMLALLSQDIESEPIDRFTLDAAQAKVLNRRVEACRNGR